MAARAVMVTGANAKPGAGQGTSVAADSRLRVQLPRWRSKTSSSELGRRLLINNYRQSPVVMARGEGCALFDVEGRRYLDMTAGVAVCVLGHGHPGLADAIAAQARRLMHVSNLYFIEAQLRFARGARRAAPSRGARSFATRGPRRTRRR